MVGAPWESLGPVEGAGQATLLRGSAAGLTATGSRAYAQDTGGVPGTPEGGDAFAMTEIGFGEALPGARSTV
ncbi:hypothetical protein [Streptomyces sp. NPDC058751]|uniref:hypothetical protein n=1 Tax=Streptomyces sp. NPDC058751 TaxID=3346623 RepID=UPI0036ADFE86